MKHPNLYLIWRPVCLLALSLLLCACGLSNLQQEQTNTELASLNEKIEKTQSSIEALAEQLTILSKNEANWQPELELIQAELIEIKTAQAKQAQVARASEVPEPSLSEPLEPIETGKMSLGRVEWLWMTDVQRYFASQLDTRLELSIIFAETQTSFERDGEKWLRFSVVRNAWPSLVEAKIRRSERIQHVGGGTIRGQVVSLPVQLADFSDELEFIVLEKKKNYPQFILGKNFMTDVAVVDVSEKYQKQKNPEFVRAESAKRKAYEEDLKLEAELQSEQETGAIPRINKNLGS